MATQPIHIRPVSDLRNKFPEIESLAKGGQPVFLTKNGHGTLVVVSLEKYAQMAENIELKLDEADAAAEASQERFEHAAVFSRLKNDKAF